MQQFQEAFKELESRTAHFSPWVKNLRQPAFERFSQLGFPTRQDEEWKYTNVSPISKLPLKWPAPKTEIKKDLISPYMIQGAVNLVFVDGLLSSSLSQMQGMPQDLVLENLSEGLQKNDPRVQKFLEEIPADDNAFTALNQAFLYSGVYLHVPRNVQVERPLHLIYVQTAGKDPKGVFPKNLISVEEGASATIMESYVAEEGAVYFVNPATEIKVAQNASLKHFRLQLDSLEAFHVGTLRAVVARDGRLESFQMSLGAKLARTNLDVILNGENADVVVDGLYLAKGTQHVDNHTSIDHRVPHARSSQLYKGIMNDQSRAVFNGKIFVRRDAQQTQAFQLNKNLLLSKGAEIDTKPQLEIDANDVKCTHGATIGRLGTDEYFYLLSRGIPPRTAEMMLCEAFAGEVIGKINQPLIKTFMASKMRYFFVEQDA